MASPQLEAMDTIARMSKALRNLGDLDNQTLRAVAYINADISDADVLAYDAAALRSAKAWRDVFGHIDNLRAKSAQAAE